MSYFFPLVICPLLPNCDTRFQNLRRINFRILNSGLRRSLDSKTPIVRAPHPPGSRISTPYRPTPAFSSLMMPLRARRGPPNRTVRRSSFLFSPRFFNLSEGVTLVVNFQWHGALFPCRVDHSLGSPFGQKIRTTKFGSTARSCSTLVPK